MTRYRPTNEKPESDPRDREPADEAPATPTDEPKPVPVQDPPVSEPRAPYTVTDVDVVSEKSRGTENRDLGTEN